MKRLVVIAVIALLASGNYFSDCAYAKDESTDKGDAALTQTSMAAAFKTTSEVIIDGTAVTFNAYNINGNNFFKLRDLAFALNGSTRQFEVAWDETVRAIRLNPGQKYTAVGGELSAGVAAASVNAVRSSATVFLDGRDAMFTAYNISDYNYIELRDLARAMDFGVDWDAAGNRISIDTAKTYYEPIDLSSYEPVIDPDNFVDVIDNPYMPMPVGTTYIFEGTSEDGPERNEVVVTDQKKMIMGVRCTVVSDQVWVDGDLEERTFDWYAQDKDGNVWYFGEDSQSIEDGKVVDREGSWEAGVDGALPGIVMKAAPKVGDAYRQEYYAGEAEDLAFVVSINETLDIGYGQFTDVIKTKEWTPLEPGVAENKYYAAGVGVILEKMVEGGIDTMELIEIIEPE